MAVRYFTRDGDTVDWIAWRHYGSKSPGATEAILAANPGLADAAILPPGLTITLPDLPAPAVQRVIRLWD